MQYQVVQTDQTAENGQKTHFWLFGSFKNPFLRFLNDPLWPGNLAEHWRTFSSIKICNIKSIGLTKVKKTAKNLIFGYLDHSKMISCGFWMIQHVPYWSRIVSTIFYYLDMQYEVHPTDQSRDIDLKVNGSFKNFTPLTKKIEKMCSRFFPDMRFSRWFQGKS